jgi:hypothetical protein
MSDETTVASEEQEATPVTPVEDAPAPAATTTKAGEQPDLTPKS